MSLPSSSRSSSGGVANSWFEKSLESVLVVASVPVVATRKKPRRLRKAQQKREDNETVRMIHNDFNIELEVDVPKQTLVEHMETIAMIAEDVNILSILSDSDLDWVQYMKYGLKSDLST